MMSWSIAMDSISNYMDKGSLESVNFASILVFSNTIQLTAGIPALN